MAKNKSYDGHPKRMISPITNHLMDLSMSRIIQITNPTIINIKLLADYVWHKFKTEGVEGFCNIGGSMNVIIKFLQQSLGPKDSDMRNILSTLFDKDNDIINLLDNLTIDLGDDN